MELWIKEEQCTGCAACANKCSRDAIELVWNERGYSRPVIDNTRCVDCGLCQKSCPVYKAICGEDYSVEPKREEPEIYAAWSRTYATRYNSTSGGAFSELAKAAMRQGAYICGAVYDDNQMVHHEIINTQEGLERVRQSKYTQSDIGDVFRQIKKLLKKKKQVVFCGAPCQVSGLYEYLGGDHGKLITVDFICRGINSPMAYRAWLDDLEEEYGARATRVWFKNKELGWNKFSTRVDFENGKVYRKSRYEDLFMRGYLERNLFIRPSCTQCQFKGMPRPADITLADFWKIDKELDADLGTSMLIINSEKGDRLFEKARNQLVVHKRTYEEALQGNLCLVKSVNTGIKSEKFFELIEEGKTFSQAFRLAIDEMPQVSVILTIERDSKYLADSISSICEQKYKNFEVLLICASTDTNLIRKLQLVANRNECVRLLPYNGDLVEAKNMAIAEAKGEYLHFCTGREILYPAFYNTLIEKMLDCKAKIMCFGWDDEKNVAMCRNAFSGTGNQRSLIELVLTEVDESSDYTGYGSYLWNKIIHKDVITDTDSRIEFSKHGLELSNMFWLIQCALCCKNVLFDSSTMMKRWSDVLVPNINPSDIALKEFFGEEENTLQLLYGVEEYAYKEMCRVCFEYEVKLLNMFRSKNMVRTAEECMNHLAIFHELPLNKEEIIEQNANALVLKNQNASLKKDSTFLSKKVSTLEKEMALLKQKVGSLEEERMSLRKKAEGLEKDRDCLRTKVSNVEKQRLALTEEVVTLEKSLEGAQKDRTFLKKKVTGLESKKSLLEEKVDCLEKDRTFLKGKAGSLALEQLVLQEKIQELEKDRSFLKGKVVRLEEDRRWLKKKKGELEDSLAEYRGSFLVRVAFKIRSVLRRIKRFFVRK